MASATSRAPTGFNQSMYQNLKQHVTDLKKEQARTLKSSEQAQGVVALEVLRVQQHYEEQLTACKQEIAGLQQHLAERTERSSKLRVQLDREKKAAGLQQERLQKLVQQLHDDHDKALADAKARHAADLEDLRKQLAAQAVQHDDERRRLEDEKQLVAKELDEWCEGEVEAVKSQAAEAVEAARAAAAACKAQLERQQGKTADALQLLEAANAQLAQERGAGRALRERVDELQERVQREACDKRQLIDQCETERQLGREQLKSAQLEHSAAIQDQRARRVMEMEAVQGRLRHIISKKDAIIAMLKVELEGAAARGRQVEQMLQAQQHELLAGPPDTCGVGAA
jgi:chromosome segregation ATPase